MLANVKLDANAIHDFSPKGDANLLLVFTYVVYERLSVMHKQVSVH